MLKTCLLVISLAAPSDVIAQGSKAGDNRDNDLSKTVRACGKPATDVARKGQYAAERDLTYRGVTLTFLDTLPDSWVLFSVKRPRHRLVYGAGALPEARRLLSCVPNLNK